VLYDKFHKLVFVTNSLLNRVDVLSSVDAHLLTRISVPSPSGIDITPDGSKVIVGTNGRFNFSGGVNYFFVIDPISLKVTDKVATDIPPNNFGQADDNALPDFPAALSTGKILFNSATSGSSGRELLLYDPINGTFTPRFDPPYIAFPGVMARSGDGSKVLIADDSNSGSVVLYDAVSDSFIASANFPGGIFILSLAANSDGTQFLVNGSTVLDGQLHTITKLNLSPGQRFNACYSPDGKRIYLRRTRQTTNSLPGGGTVTISDEVITVIDASNFSALGDVPAVSLPNGPVSSLGRMAVDEVGRVFEIEDGGISFTDASMPSGQLPVHTQGLALPGAAQPSAGLAGAPSPITLNGQGFANGDTVLFGSVAGNGVAVNSANSLQVTPPASLKVGPVDLTLHSPDGWDYLAPEGYSYNPYVLYQDVNAGDVAGGTAVHLIGYGFGNDQNRVTVTVGGHTATVTKVQVSSFTLPLNHLYFTTPPGALGTADVVVTTPYGSTTVPAGFEYLSVQETGLITVADQIVLDEKRHQIFVSDIAASRVHVLSQDTLQPLSAILTPNGTNGLAITPDDKFLLVTSVNGLSLSRINLDNFSDIQTFPAVAPLSVPSSALGDLRPLRVVATSSGVAFVSNEAVDGSFNGLLAKLDFLNGGVSHIGEQLAGTGQCCIALAATPDGNHVFYGGWRWDASTDRFTALPLDAMDAIDLAVSTDGNVLLDRLHTYDMRSAKLATRSIYFDLFDQTQGDFRGVQMDGGGALLFRPVDQTVRIYDVNTGALLKTIGLSAPMNGAFISNLAVDKAGKNLFVISNAGLIAVHLSQVPLSIGEVDPNASLPAGGEFVLVHGSGFVPGAMVSFGSQILATTYIDQNTLQVIAPAGQLGATSVTVTLPNQSSYTLPASYHYVKGSLVPTIVSISPQQPLVVPINTLTVTGTNFLRNSQVQADGVVLQSTFVDSTRIIATNGFAVAGQRQVTVVNPGPGGGSSNPVIVNFQNQTPAIISLSPNLVVAKGSAFPLIVGGEGFYKGSQVLWNGSVRNTRYVSFGELDADISAADIATAGTAQITVSSPGPGGGTSQAASLTIGDGVPVLLVRLNPDAGSVVQYNNTTFGILLQNTGTGPLQISGVSSDNSEFAPIGLSDCVGHPIPVSFGCDLTIQFAPTQVGPRTAHIQLTDNTKNNSDTLVVTGTGISSFLTFLPSKLDFGTQLVTASAGKTVTVTNTQTSALNLVHIGTSASQFSETDNCGTTIAASASCQVNITFGAATAAQWGANLGVTDAVQGAHLVQLTGTTLDFSIQPKDNAITVKRGQSSNSSVMVTTIGGSDLGQSVALSCSGLPASASCTFASQQANPGAGSVGIPLTITAAGQSSNLRPPAFWSSYLWALVMPLGLLLLRKNTRGVLLVIVTSILVQASCGGGGSAGVTPAPVGSTVNGTPAGTYTIQVTGTIGSLQHSAPITLTIQ